MKELHELLFNYISKALFS